MSNLEKKKIAFTGGGTGGHIYPIIAVLEKLKQNPNLEFVYFGSKDKLEEKISQENNIYFVPLPLIGGMPRSLKIFFWLFKFLYACLCALIQLKKNKPSLIFGTGGYSSAPVFFAALILRIPYIIHNLDAHLGLANLAFIRHCAALTLGLPLNQKIIYPQNGPILLVGNPLREAFWQNTVDAENIKQNLKLSPNRKTLIITGGSQGAFALNNIILQIAPKLIENNWQIIHQLGENQFSQFERIFPQSVHYKPFKYLNNLWQIYSIADLAISRAGAMSIAELIAKQIPTIFIPLPSAAQNHQWHNAKQIEKAGACIVLEQKNLTEGSLLERIDFAMQNKNILKINLSQIKSSQNSADTIALLLMNKLQLFEITD